MKKKTERLPRLPVKGKKVQMGVVLLTGTIDRGVDCGEGDDGNNGNGWL
jgi:hypothetical protein